jgi:hypothetical protein
MVLTEELYGLIAIFTAPSVGNPVEGERDSGLMPNTIPV